MHSTSSAKRWVLFSVGLGCALAALYFGEGANGYRGRTDWGDALIALLFGLGSIAAFIGFFKLWK